MTRRIAFSSIALVAAAGGAATMWWLMAPVRPSPLEPGWPAVVTTLAGDGVQGHRDGSRTSARFSDPFGVAVAADGSIYIADAGETNAIRRLLPDGSIVTVAGGIRGFRDGQGAAAQFDTPSGMAADRNGTLYVADAGNDAIRRITPAGYVSTVVARNAGLRGPLGVAVDSQGRIVIADTYNDRIAVAGFDGTITTLAGGTAPGFADGSALYARFDTPSGIAADPTGNVYVADLGNGVIRVISRDGNVQTIAPGFGDPPFRPLAIAVADDGFLYVADERGRILEITPSRGSRVVAGSGIGFADGADVAARFRGPSGLAVVAPGQLVVADRRNALLRRVMAKTRLDLLPAAPLRAPAFDVESFGRRPLLWPFAPYEGPFEVTGTLGEPRGGVGSERFHAGLDVHAAEGTIVHAVRSAVVDSPSATAEFGSLSESIRIGPIAYVHLRVGRDRRNNPFADERFIFTYDDTGLPIRVRVRRGARFELGEALGTVNRFYHAHLNVGWPGEEHNPLAFTLANFADTIPPVIARVLLLTEDHLPLKERVKGRLQVSGRVRIVVDAWDRVDGNLPRRRLGLYRLGYQLLNTDGSPAPGFETSRETIQFDRQPADAAAARLIYASGSGIPAFGNRSTRFFYVVTSRLRSGIAEDGLLDTATVPPGNYTLRILAADIQGNEAVSNRDLPITIRASGSLDQR